MAERSSVVTIPEVTRDDRQEGRMDHQSCGCCQMNGVQSADRFNRKWASGMGKDRISDTQEVTTSAS